ncbi:Ku protein [Nakamurella antarctica]|uniref:Non-homologous end joining protein Ku n=1 Tax=Nakamurella antarctica TaxID=1902245 RepID=A0A3G8ZUK1_9ACTN|nr:Ku protein [Nakamurella antarctica]AZI58174.1 Ku protein [Nakamurella antarctica]
MRPIWTGSVAFGLVNVPVKLYSGTEDHDVRFHQVHAADGGRIRYSRICELDGEKVDFADIQKAYEASDGRVVVVTNEDLASLPINTDKEIQVLSFVPSEQIDPILFDKSYLLEPAGASIKSYVLLAEALADVDRVAIVNFALRQKTRLAALRVRDGALLVQTLLWPDEVRAAEFDSLDRDVKISPVERKMARSLIDSFADDFHPEEHADRYREELQQLIDAKLDGGEAFTNERPDSDGEDAEVLDLLAALQRSVDKNAGTSPSVRTRPATSAAPKHPAAKTGAKAKTPVRTKPAAKTPAAQSAPAKARAAAAAPGESPTAAAAEKPTPRKRATKKSA